MRSILHSNPLRNAIKNQIQNNSNIASSQSQKRRLCLFCARLSSSSSSSATKVNSRPYSTFSVNLRNSNPYLTSSSCFGQTSIPSSSIHQSSRSISSKSTPPKTIQLSPTREPTMDLQEEDPDLFHTLNRIDRKVNLTERAVEVSFGLGSLLIKRFIFVSQTDSLFYACPRRIEINLIVRKGIKSKSSFEIGCRTWRLSWLSIQHEGRRHW